MELAQLLHELQLGFPVFKVVDNMGEGLYYFSLYFLKLLTVFYINHVLQTEVF